MKIVHVITNLGNGGAEKFVVELANEQAKIHDVSIISFRDVEEWMFPPKKIQPAVFLFQLGKQPGFKFSFLTKLIALLRRLKPDIINCHLDATVRYIYIASFFLLPAKYIQTVHCNLYSGKARFFDQLEILPFFKKKFVNVCISESIYYEFTEKYKNMYFRHIDNAIGSMRKSVNFFQVEDQVQKFKKNNEKIFVAIGRFSDQKNFIMLVKLFKRLKKENKNVILLIIGGNSKDKEQKKQMDAIKKIKCENTFLLGKKENVDDYLFLADALSLSSKFEGLPIVMLEALSVGLPILSTPAGGVKDIIKNRENGFIANGFEEEDLYMAVSSFLEISPEERAKIKLNNIRLYEEKFSMRNCAKKYISLYKEIMDEKAGLYV